MALAVLFLLLGILFAEVSLLGLPLAGMAGAGCLAVCAALLARLWWLQPQAEAHARADVREPGRRQVHA